MLHWVLIVLTAASPGQPHLAVTPAQDAADCADKADLIRQVLTVGGYHIVALDCGQTAVQMTPYRHGHDPDQVIHAYRVTLPGKDRPQDLVITPLNGQPCQPAPDAVPAVYCALSQQQVTK